MKVYQRISIRKNRSLKENEGVHMKRPLLFERIYDIFMGGFMVGVLQASKNNTDDSFEQLHREFLWLKNEQLNSLIPLKKQDPIFAKNFQIFFNQIFIDTLTQESIGGNAGAGHTGINAFYHPVTGEIKHFGNFHELREAFWDEVTGQTTLEGDYHCIFRINVQHTGKIVEVLFEQQPLTHQAKERLLGLEGVQIMIPFTRVYKALRKAESFEEIDPV